MSPPGQNFIRSTVVDFSNLAPIYLLQWDIFIFKSPLAQIKRLETEYERNNKLLLIFWSLSNLQCPNVETKWNRVQLMLSLNAVWLKRIHCAESIQHSIFFLSSISFFYAYILNLNFIYAHKKWAQYNTLPFQSYTQFAGSSHAPYSTLISSYFTEAKVSPGPKLAK